jgi:glucosamine-6-phosphate deaminase
VNLVVYDQTATLAAALAHRVADAIRQKPGLVLGLPTGRTPLALYEQLRALTASGAIDWSHVRTFNLDEFAGLDGRDERSYRRFMERQLFDHVNLPRTQIHFLDGRAPDAAAECERYERALSEAGGLDLQILGIGANGHVGFNEPGDALAARTHLARLHDQSRADNAWWFGEDVSEVPGEALSMGMATILSARAIVLMATGPAKSPAVAAMIGGPLTTRLPASFLQLHPNVTVMVDRAAAGA